MSELLIERLQAEKNALDQLLVESLKASLSSKTDAILWAGKASKLQDEIKNLKEENEKLKKELQKEELIAVEDNLNVING